RDGPPVVSVDGRSLRRDLGRVAEGFDVAVIDTAPPLGAGGRAAMLPADPGLPPLGPGAAGTGGLAETGAVVAGGGEERPRARGVGGVLSRAAKTTLTGVTREALEKLKVPVIGTLGDRVAFGEATAQGQGVTEYDASSKAAREVDELVEAVLKAVQGDEG